MEKQTTVRVIAAVGDVIAILGALLATVLYFGGVGSVPDSFLANMIAVAGIASGVVVVVVPIGLRTLGTEDPLNEFLLSFRRPLRDAVGEGPYPWSQLLAKALFVSVVPSPLSFLGDTVLSFVVSIGFSLYSNLHGDNLGSAFLGFAFLVLGFLLLVEAGVAVLIVRRTGGRREPARTGQ